MDTSFARWMNMKSSELCTLIGILDDGWPGLSEGARQRLVGADEIIGAGRTLQLVREHLPADAVLRDMDGALGEVPGWIDSILESGRRCVLLGTGDPLCHGMASWLAKVLGKERFAVLPALSTLQLAFARFKQPWPDYRIASCHTADAGEWVFGATPEHGLYPLMRILARHRRVALFTGPHNTPDRLARALICAGYPEARLSVACRRRNALPGTECGVGRTPRRRSGATLRSE
jgi:precorrin-6B C5,15-methyltransferase / cobalt-precorrin-6B C5,C15-methyltransferase